MQVTTKIYADGSCDPNPGEAGSGLAVYRNNVVEELWYGHYDPSGTNNTAELNALKHALQLAEREISAGRSVAVFSDSLYSIQCVVQWAPGWKARGWSRKGGEIKNLDLIRDMFAFYESLGENIPILHVNGHVGIEGNELADRMSVIARESRVTGLVRYVENLDVSSILAFRSG